MSHSLKQLAAGAIAEAVVEARMAPLDSGVAERFSQYSELLMRWNEKLNLTSIRNPSEVLQRHFVECIFCAQILPAEISTLLDYGSGAGFPGIPIALCRPEIRVTLSESQHKKAAFLREAARSLGLEVEVHGARTEEMAQERVFDAVALRAVDKMQESTEKAALRVSEGGWLILLSGSGDIHLPEGFTGTETLVPGSTKRVVVLARRSMFHVEH